jgi:hypothetical protein
MKLTIGYWLIPLIITIVSFLIANNYNVTKGGYINIDFEGMFRFTAALIVSLVCWLIYALLT